MRFANSRFPTYLLINKADIPYNTSLIRIQNSVLNIFAIVCLCVETNMFMLFAVQLILCGIFCRIHHHGRLWNANELQLNVCVSVLLLLPLRLTSYYPISGSVESDGNAAAVNMGCLETESIFRKLVLFASSQEKYLE